MRISVFGLGYVGAVSIGCLARDGHEVVGVDLDRSKLELIRNGRSPIVERGMQELFAAAARNPRFRVTEEARDAVLATDLSFVCVGTPGLPNGDQDTSAIRRVSEQIGDAIARKPDYHLVVMRSTVIPGTVEEVVRPILEHRSEKRAGVDFDVCFQPEFLREGSSIQDYDNPPFTVVGADSERAAATLRSLYGHLDAELVVTSLRSAEMLKYACNAFHAVKVTFANEIGRLSQALGVDPHLVMQTLCRDKVLNISPAYLRPGFAFGGSCLPKDLRAVLYAGKRNDVSLPMLEGVVASNQRHVEHAVGMVLASGRRKVGLLGLSFKSGTDDLRESPLVTLAERFIGKGLSLAIYDAEVNLSRLIGANRRYIEEVIPHIARLMTDDSSSLIADSEVLVVGQCGPEIAATLYRETHPDQLIVDLVNIPQKERLRGTYAGVCW